MQKVKALNGIVLPLAPVKPSPFWFGYDLALGVVNAGVVDYRGVNGAGPLVNEGVVYGQHRRWIGRN